MPSIEDAMDKTIKKIEESTERSKQLKQNMEEERKKKLETPGKSKVSE